MQEKAKILIIEDDQSARRALKEAFIEAGFEILEAGDGVHGLKIIKDNPPHLILLDMMLPGMNGSEILKKLQENPDQKDIPVIILSGLSDAEVVSQIMDAGVFDYFSKQNVNIDELIAKVKKKLNII